MQKPENAPPQLISDPHEGGFVFRRQDDFNVDAPFVDVSVTDTPHGAPRATTFHASSPHYYDDYAKYGTHSIGPAGNNRVELTLTTGYTPDHEQRATTALTVASLVFRLSGLPEKPNGTN